jgi:CTP:molybdopterin cytidylyltransferase MocA
VTGSSESSLAAVVLAAGTFDDGTPLAVGKWGAVTVARHLVDLGASVAHRVVVVLGADGDRIAEGTDFGSADIVIDPEWQEGSAAPLRAGLDTLSRDPSIEHVIIFEATTPVVDREVVEALVAAHLEVPHSRPGRRLLDKSATVPKFRYALALPVIIGRSLWERFLGMEGDAAVLQTLSAHPDWVNEIWIDRLPPTPMRTTEDLATIAPRR